MIVAENTDYFSRLAQNLQDRDDRPAWLADLQKQAWSAFEKQGWPNKRNEPWRFTPLKPVIRADYGPAPEGDADLSGLLLEAESDSLVFVNGAYRADLSRLRERPGVSLQPLNEAVRGAQAATVKAHFSSLADPALDALCALNTALCDEGVFLEVAAGVSLEEPIEIIHVNRAGERAFSCQPRHLIVAGENSHFSVVETYAGDGGAVFTNTVTELVVGAGAQLDHYFREQSDERSWHVHQIAASLGDRARLGCHALLTGGALVRNGLRFTFEGEGAEATGNGLFVGHGTQLHDNHVCADHKMGHNVSNQFYKGVLDEQARGVYTGRVVVRADAQKTDSRQTNRNLLLSDKARVDSQPQLEIYADDVKCAHGATTGQIDEDALFYMQARGIDPDAARVLLLYAFAHEVIDRLPLASLRNAAEAFLLERFAAKGILGETP